jgi:hypothetical protein
MLPDWGAGLCVGYAYENGLTNGISAEQLFGAQEQSNAETSYLTLSCGRWGIRTGKDGTSPGDERTRWPRSVRDSDGCGLFE